MELCQKDAGEESDRSRIASGEEEKRRVSCMVFRVKDFQEVEYEEERVWADGDWIARTGQIDIEFEEGESSEFLSQDLTRYAV